MLDQKLFFWIYGLAGKSRILDLLGIFLADYLGYFLIFLAIYLIFSKKDWKIRSLNFLFTALVLIVSRGLLTELIRYFYSRPRPFLALGVTALIDHDPSAAFPSGHAAFYFALALSIFYLINRAWGWRFLAAVLLIGLARIFVGVHWPLDIVGGFAVALASFWTVKWLFRDLPLF